VELLLLIINQYILLVNNLTLFEQLLSLSSYLLAVEGWVYQISMVFVSNSNETFFLSVRAPFDLINNFVLKFVFSHDSASLNVPDY